MWIHQLHILALLSCISWLRAFQHPAPVQGSYRIHPTARTVLFSTTTAAPIADGIVKTVSKSGQGDQVNLGDIATVKYSCYLPNEKSAPFAKARQQKIAVGDGTMIQGWDKAIRTMKVGERAVIRISDPSLGYGDTGFPPLIPPRAEIEIDLEILDSQSPTTNIDFDNLAMADNTPVSIIKQKYDGGMNPRERLCSSATDAVLKAHHSFVFIIFVFVRNLFLIANGRTNCCGLRCSESSKSFRRT